MLRSATRRRDKGSRSTSMDWSACSDARSALSRQRVISARWRRPLHSTLASFRSPLSWSDLGAHRNHGFKVQRRLTAVRGVVGAHVSSPSSTGGIRCVLVEAAVSAVRSAVRRANSAATCSPWALADLSTPAERRRRFPQVTARARPHHAPPGTPDAREQCGTTEATTPARQHRTGTRRG